MRCTVPRLADIPATPLDPRWEVLPRLAVASFLPIGSTHRPAVHVQLGHSGDHLHLRFSVQDRYVLSRAGSDEPCRCRGSGAATSSSVRMKARTRTGAAGPRSARS